MQGREKRWRLSVKVKNLGWPELMDELKHLAGGGKISGGAGVTDQDQVMHLTRGQQVEHKSYINNIELALIHEYGAKISQYESIPERSFIRSTFDDNQQKYIQYAHDYARMVYEGKITVEEACGRLARRLANDVKAKIESNIPPPLLPDTIKRRIKRGNLSAKTLIDSGVMRDAIVGVIMSGVEGTAIRKIITANLEDIASESIE